jgi:hypothetical protein
MVERGNRDTWRYRLVGKRNAQSSQRLSSISRVMGNTIPSRGPGNWPTPQLRAEVEDFVDFLRARKERARDAAAQRLGEAFAKLDALNQHPRPLG